MKNILILLILILFSFISYSQIFPEPTGASATDPDKSKTINKCASSASSGIQAPKTNTIARRYSFDLQIWNELYQLKGREWKLLGCTPSFTCIDCNTCPVGWNKIGRISFNLLGSYDKVKLHLGWRADPENNQMLKMSAYFHEVDQSSDPDYFVSHYIKSVPTDSEQYIDMYMSQESIALIVDKTAVVMRKPGWTTIFVSDSFLKRTFYFGDEWYAGTESCLTPVEMKIKFKNQQYDWTGFPEKLNTCKYITVNISNFQNNDEHTFYAYKEMYGSISDNNTSYVYYEPGHPDPNKQKCIISKGANITFSAGEKILLYPGFHAQSGSHFKAELVQKEKYFGYYDEAKKLNLPPLEQGSCDKVEGDNFNQIEEFDSNYGTNITTDIPIHTKERFAIYPNPHPGNFNIELYDETINKFTIEITNMMGTSVYYRDNVSPGLTQIDISNQAVGIYFVKIQAGDKSYLEKVVYR